MNVCFLAYFPMIPYAGGVQRVTTTLSCELEARGHSVVYLFYDAEYESLQKHTDIKFPQYYIDITTDDEDEVKKDFRKFLTDHNIDLVINQTLDERSCFLLNLVCMDVKVISVHHTVPFAAHFLKRRNIWKIIPGHPSKLLLYKTVALISPIYYRHHAINKERQLFYSTLQCSDKLVFISNRFFNRILHYMPDFPKEKLAAINNPNTFRVSKDVDFEKKENLVLWVGRVDQNKNCLDFIKAWRLFSKKHTDWKAIVVGDGCNLTACHKWARIHEVHNIEFVGKQTDVKQYYIRAKIFVSTSLSESWGMVVTEAMSFGCVPCTYDTYETLSDIVDDGQNGLVCEPTPKELVNKINSLVLDENKMKELSSNAILKVSSFSVSKICDQWSLLFKSIGKE